MIKLYTWNVGWVMGRRDGKNVYTKHKEGAKPYLSEWDKEFIAAAREAEAEGHHLDKVKV